MYEHTQRGYLHYLLFFMATGSTVFVASGRVPIGVAAAVLISSGVFVLLGLSIAALTTRCDRETLTIGFGPIPLIKRQIRVRDIHAARAAQSSWIDGWGIHWVPGRGWTWNIWGFECVELETSAGSIRVGTDDAPGLVAFLTPLISAS